MPQLDPTYFLSQVFWLLICFAVLFFAIYFWVLPSFNRITEKRNKEIESIIKRTVTIQNEIVILTKQNNNMIVSAKEEANKIIETATLQSNERYEQYKSEILAIFDKKIKESELLFNKKKNKAIANAKKDYEYLTQDILKKYIRLNNEQNSEKK